MGADDGIYHPNQDRDEPTRDGPAGWRGGPAPEGKTRVRKKTPGRARGENETARVRERPNDLRTFGACPLSRCLTMSFSSASPLSFLSRVLNAIAKPSYRALRAPYIGAALLAYSIARDSVRSEYLGF